MVSGTENEPPDVERKVKDGRPFTFTPLPGAGTNGGEEYYQKCLAEYCQDVGVPFSAEATFLRSRRHRHRERPPASKIRERLDLGRYASFIDVYQLNHQDRALDLRHVPRPAVARWKTAVATSPLQDKLVRRISVTDHAADKHADVFLQQAREAILQETKAVEARRAARVRHLAMNPPKVYKLDWNSCEPFPDSSKVVAIEDDADIAQELACGRDNTRTGGQSRVLRKTAGDGLRPLRSGTTQTPKDLEQGKPLQPLPAKPALADAAARFRVTRDMASTLSMENLPGKLVVNSVGDILRHEKLRRLKKVLCMAILREEGSAIGEFPEGAPIRDAQMAVPRGILDKGTANMVCTFGLAEDQQAEVAMLTDAAAVDFHFLQRRSQNTQVWPVETKARPKTTLPCGISNARLLADHPDSEGVLHMQSQQA
eukprot:g5036.t2